VTHPGEKCGDSAPVAAQTVGGAGADILTDGSVDSLRIGGETVDDLEDAMGEVTARGRSVHSRER